MIINLTKEQIKDVFGELRYMGADNCYKYDKESRKRTDEVEALRQSLFPYSIFILTHSGIHLRQGVLKQGLRRKSCRASSDTIP